MRVYIVCGISDGVFCGIFLNKAKAEERAYLMGECEVLTYEFNSPDDEGDFIEE